MFCIRTDYLLQLTVFVPASKIRWLRLPYLGHTCGMADFKCVYPSFPRCVSVDSVQLSGKYAKGGKLKPWGPIHEVVLAMRNLSDPRQMLYELFLKLSEWNQPQRYFTYDTMASAIIQPLLWVEMHACIYKFKYLCICFNDKRLHRGWRQKLMFWLMPVDSFSKYGYYWKLLSVIGRSSKLWRLIYRIDDAVWLRTCDKNHANLSPNPLQTRL